MSLEVKSAAISRGITRFEYHPNESRNYAMELYPDSTYVGLARIRLYREAREIIAYDGSYRLIGNLPTIVLRELAVQRDLVYCLDAAKSHAFDRLIAAQRTGKVKSDIEEIWKAVAASEYDRNVLANNAAILKKPVPRIV